MTTNRWSDLAKSAGAVPSTKTSSPTKGRGPAPLPVKKPFKPSVTLRAKETGVLKFTSSAILHLLEKLKPTDPVVLVYDDGVYIMSLADKGTGKKDGNVEGRTLVYAQGCDPSRDQNWWETKGELIGGDDGVDDIGTCESLALMLNGKSWLVIKPTPETLELYTR